MMFNDLETYPRRGTGKEGDLKCRKDDTFELIYNQIKCVWLVYFCLLYT